jgi:hypothetical protein
LQFHERRTLVGLPDLLVTGLVAAEAESLCDPRSNCNRGGWIAGEEDEELFLIVGGVEA